MDIKIRTVVNHGLISGILMATGVIVGLTGVGADKTILMAAVLVVAFSDAFSDTLGLYLSKNDMNDQKMLGQSLAIAFFAKIIIASTFLLPLLLAGNLISAIICIIWAALLLVGVGYYMHSQAEKKKIAISIIQYVIVLTLVAAVSYYIGDLFKGYYFK